MVRTYLISTEHLENVLWFRDREDFITGMNHVAVQASFGKVIVLAFTLMSNHVHFVLKGKYDDVEDFANGFKQRYSKYYRHKYGVQKFLRHNNVDIREIPWADEAPERAIAYVHMNCVAGNICSHPFQYPWGSGGLFFCESHPSGRRVDSLSKRALMHLIHSKADTVPGDWIIGEDGYILPHCYVNVKAVEARYRTPKRMDYFLWNSSKARVKLEISENQLPSFSDQVILSAVPELCRSLFQKKSFQSLSPEEQTEFARQVRFRFSSSPNQIARVCGITYAEVAKILDSV